MRGGIMHVVFFSSGAGSWAAAKRVAEEHGTDSLVLLFADTKIEDEDNYRYLHDAAENVGGRLVIVEDGRTPWDVFRAKRWIGNSRVAQCSKELKQDVCRAWLDEHDPQHEALLYVGIDWSEINRLPAIEKGWAPRRVVAPLCSPPYLSKRDLLDMGRAEGLEPPRLYGMGFSHANCGGFCVRGGHGHFTTLLKAFPERYAHHAAKEEEMRQFLGREDVSILVDERGGEKKALTLKALRERVESDGQIDLLDIGGCGCFLDPQE